MLIIWAAVMAAMKAAAAAAAKKAIVGVGTAVASKSTAGSLLMGMAKMGGGGGGKKATLPEPMQAPQEAPQQGLTGPLPVQAAERPPVKMAQAEDPSTRMSRGLTGGEMVLGGVEGLLFGGGLKGIPQAYQSMRRAKANAPYVQELERRLEGSRSESPDSQRRLELEKMLSASKGSDTPDYIRSQSDQIVSRPRYTQGAQGRTMMEEMSAVQRGGVAPRDEEYRSSGKRPIGADPTSDSQDFRKRLAAGVRAAVKTSKLPPSYMAMIQGGTAMNAYKAYYPDEHAKWWGSDPYGTSSGESQDAQPTSLMEAMDRYGIPEGSLTDQQRGLLESYYGAQ